MLWGSFLGRSVAVLERSAGFEEGWSGSSSSSVLPYSAIASIQAPLGVLYSNVSLLIVSIENRLASSKVKDFDQIGHMLLY